jgi:HEAT repeat protein
VSSRTFDLLIAITSWLSIAFLACSVGLMLFALALRRRNAGRRVHRDDVLKAWHELFVASVNGELRAAFPLAATDTLAVIGIWNGVKASRGDGGGSREARALDDVARSAGFDKIARTYVERGDAAEKIAGATTLGYLRDARAVDRLHILGADHDGDVSFAAARALLRIDPSTAGIFLANLSRRRDWVPTRVEPVLTAAADIVGPEFLPALARADEEARVRLLGYAATLGPGIARPAALECLRGDAATETIAAALRTLRTAVEPGDLLLLCTYVEHAAPAVRVQAVNALASLEEAEVDELLLLRLRDRNPWVRQRAAEALAARTGDRPGLLERARSDRFAHQSLTYAFEGSAPAVEGGAG